MKPHGRVVLIAWWLALAVRVPAQGPTGPSEPQAAPTAQLVFYGYTLGPSPRKAFLLKGSRIYIAIEGDLIEDRYKLVRIEGDSAVVEDTSNSYRWTLTLPSSSLNPDRSVAQGVPGVASPGTTNDAVSVDRTGAGATPIVRPAVRRRR